MLRFKASALIILLSIVLASCGNNQNKEPLQAKPAEAAPVATEVPVKQKNILFFFFSLYELCRTAGPIRRFFEAERSVVEV